MDRGDDKFAQVAQVGWKTGSFAVFCADNMAPWCFFQFEILESLQCPSSGLSAKLVFDDDESSAEHFQVVRCNHSDNEKEWVKISMLREALPIGKLMKHSQVGLHVYHGNKKLTSYWTTLEGSSKALRLLKENTPPRKNL